MNYLHDKEKQHAADENAYLMEDGTRRVLQESNQATLAQHFVGGHIAYKLNSRQAYLKDNLAISASFPVDKGLVNDYISQKLKGHDLLVNNVMKGNFKKKSGGVDDMEWQLALADKKGLLHIT